MVSRQESTADRLFRKAALKMELLPQIIINNRWKSWIVFLTLFFGLAAGGSRFKINQSMEAFFDKDDPTLVGYNWFKYVYGSDEYVLVMYRPADGDVFSADSLKRVHATEQKLNAERIKEGSPLSRIKRIRTLVSADYLESKDDSLYSRPFVGDMIPQNKAESEALRQLALQHKDFPGTWFSEDSSYGVMMIETDYGSRLAESGAVKDGNDPVKEEAADEFDFDAEAKEGAILPSEIPELEAPAMDSYTPFMDALKEVFASDEWKPFNTYHFAGNPVIMSFFDKVILKQIGLFSMFAVVIIWLVMLFAFRSFSALVWPTVTLVTGVVSLIGLIGWTGTEMTFMINIITFLLLSVSIAISIHVMTGYTLQIADGNTPEHALKKTYYKTGVPVVLAAVTTAIGLISLIFVPIPAIRNFGIFASLGVLLTLCSNLLLWPLLMNIWAPGLKKQTESSTGLLAQYLEGQQERALRNKTLIIVVFIAVTALFIPGLGKVYIDTNFLKMIKSGYDITESYDVIDEHFGGTAAFEILIDTGAPDGVKNAGLLRAMDDFSNAVLASEPERIVRARSVVNLTKESNQNMTDEGPAGYRIPDTDAEVAQVLVSFESADPGTRKLLVDDSWQIARITFSLVTEGTMVYQAMLDKIKALAKTHFQEFEKNLPGFRVSDSGGIRLMTKLINHVSIAQLKSFSLALIVITLVLFFVFGSLKFGLLAMVPNIFPLIIAGGAAGWLGYPLDSDTLLVMPIAIGIAVDDTIHFLTHYKSELIDGQSSDSAINSSLVKVGRAMIFTTVVLSLGFLVFVFSAYNPLKNFGILSAIAISSALIADLYLLPVLVSIFRPFRGRSAANEAAKVAGLLCILFPVLPGSGQAQAATMTGTEIARKMLDRDDGKSSWSRVMLLSCHYAQKGEKRSCKSGKRKKMLEMVSVDLDQTGKNKKVASFVMDPPSEQGVSFLQEDYADENKESEQWIWLPALRKLKKIVAAVSNGPKTGTLFGSELAYEDMEQVHLSDYSYKLLREEEEQSRKTWVLETSPTEKRRKKTSYSRALLWVDKETFLVLKSESYDRQGKLAKTFFSRQLEKQSGIWTSRQQIVVNHQNQRMSLMKSVKLAVNPAIQKDSLSPRLLKDSGFRESILAKLRQ